MRIALALLFLVSVSFPTLLRLGIVGYYEYNQAYIAKNLCENRNRPELKCCGKCYLKKQLVKADDGKNEAAPSLSQLSKFEIAPFIMPAAFELRGLVNRDRNLEFYYNQPFPEELSATIFQPPG